MPSETAAGRGMLSVHWRLETTAETRKGGGRACQAELGPGPGPQAFRGSASPGMFKLRGGIHFGDEGTKHRACWPYHTVKGGQGRLRLLKGWTGQGVGGRSCRPESQDPPLASAAEGGSSLPLLPHSVREQRGPSPSASKCQTPPHSTSSLAPVGGASVTQGLSLEGACP